ncbi:MAG TPA: hypothetical protein PL035_03795 [Bacillota bacterium]|nr:hypothetical protein [Bacillota bacterium]HQC36183.1 hypothetical protein [Bacillota bacterium]
MSKKYLCALFAFMLAFSAGACSIIERQEAVAEPSAAKAFEPVPLAVPGGSVVSDDIPEDDDIFEAPEEEYEYPMPESDDPMYEKVLRMYDGLMPLFRYFAFEGRDYELSELSADDFWLFMAMIAANTVSEETDQTGTISLSRERVEDCAASFFGDYVNANGIPSLKDSYSAHSDPGSNIISFYAIAVESYDGKLCGCYPAGGDSDAWEMVIRISKAQNQSAGEGQEDSPLSWKIHIVPWADGEEHEFAFYLEYFERFEETVD